MWVNLLILKVALMILYLTIVIQVLFLVNFELCSHIKESTIARIQQIKTSKFWLNMEPNFLDRD